MSQHHSSPSCAPQSPPSCAPPTNHCAPPTNHCAPPTSPPPTNNCPPPTNNCPPPTDHGCADAHHGSLITADVSVGHHGIDIGATVLGFDLADIHIGLDLGHCGQDWCHA
jgi:hypothetical protein